MDVDLYLLPYNVVSELVDAPLNITESVRFQQGSLNYHRYFIHFGEKERPLVKKNISDIATALRMPDSAADLLHAMAVDTDITFLGVSEESGAYIYKVYLGFVGLHSIDTDRKAFSVEWIPGNDEHVMKEYTMDPEVSKEEADRKTKESLRAVLPEYSQLADELYLWCLDVAGQTNYTAKFLSAAQKGSAKSSVYYNLTEGDPVYFENIQSKILKVSEMLNIPGETFGNWQATLLPWNILEHLAIGISNERRPFITFYKNPTMDVPATREMHALEATPSDLGLNIYENTKNSKYMEQNDKHFNHETIEADYASVLPPRTKGQETILGPSDLPSHPLRQEITPSCGCEAGSGQLVFALGDIGYDFPSSEVRDSLAAEIGSLEPEHFLKVLGGKFSDSSQSGTDSSFPDPNRHENRLFYAQSAIWTFNLDNTPIYAVRPEGPFAQEAYATLRNFMVYQIEVEKKHKKSGFRYLVRSTLAGKIQGNVRLSNGYEVPVVVPEIRGLYAWTVDQLLNELLGPAPKQGASNQVVEKYEDSKTGIIDFLERVYFALRNVGVTSKDRAINFSATNAFQIAMIFKRAYKENLTLRSIDAVRSPFCRPGTDCWDVLLVFFNPMKQLEEANTVFRFTVDVSSVVPSLTGPMRTWKE